MVPSLGVDRVFQRPAFCLSHEALSVRLLGFVHESHHIGKIAAVQARHRRTLLVLQIVRINEVVTEQMQW